MSEWLGRLEGVGRLRAVLAGGLVLGVGATMTLASWSDQEFVWGGSGTGAGQGLGSSAFEVEQNVFDGAGGAANWVDRETAPGGALSFSVAGSVLAPGRTVFAPMQLRADKGSTAGRVVLEAHGMAAGDAPLYAALTYGVRVGVAGSSCNAAGFASSGSVLVAPGTSLSSGSATDFAVPAGTASAPGAAVDLCFAVLLPDLPASQALQGLGVVPQWSLHSESQ